MHRWRLAGTRQTLPCFFQAVEQRYPQAEQIVLIHDAWPVRLVGLCPTLEKHRRGWKFSRLFFNSGPMGDAAGRAWSLKGR
jgi:chromosomal replication initiation ATPase DnaA